MFKQLQRMALIACLFGLQPLWAISFVLPAKDDIIGEVQYVNPEMGETLSAVGMRYDIGYYEMVRANPKINPMSLLDEHTTLLIPSQFILPAVPHEGIVINLAEYRLYYFPPDENIVITMPVGIGREGWTTPVGATKIISKEKNPVWRPTTNLLRHAAKHGIQIPDEFPAGEDNPLGKHVLRLGWPTYLIHGTNRRDGVGTRVSAGCIRMMPEDIEYLFNLVKVGTPVRVLNNPVKFGYLNGKLYIQIHPPLAEQKRGELRTLVETQLKQIAVSNINKNEIQAELKSPSGVPKKIS
ncbi:L,D-transpeptidase family protein [Legionella jamestowniensis]|uniref:Putative ErfK/YbiS/YcfS/YnhG family protein n=1 Tax=Legionella jamestowniensis TaxID=455 RepID=A0A0W0UN55_9GAMM|nr:L,D-transpeptidase family protein [Legionella jamestowniensis]KTD09296.1 putative ErfK/YbiS/YcfS/YnhG family protein precursor [Legionella jamestowniensis]SFL87213.1 L,D-transpeptidase ErfK/SrfK [Legionella jamestowniensis DSM 19215]